MRAQHDLLFDGDCGVCSRSAEICRRMDRHGRFRVRPYQSVPDEELRAVGLTPAICSKKVQIVTCSGGVHSGAFAVNYFLWHHPPWSVLVALIYLLPPLLLAELIGYALVARHRHRLSAWLGLSACRIGQEPVNPSGQR